MTESEALKAWVHFYQQIQTREYRIAFLCGFDPVLLPKLLNKLRIESAMDLLGAVK